MHHIVSLQCSIVVHLWYFIHPFIFSHLSKVELQCQKAKKEIAKYPIP